MFDIALKAHLLGVLIKWDFYLFINTLKTLWNYEGSLQIKNSLKHHIQMLYTSLCTSIYMMSLKLSRKSYIFFIPFILV